MTTQTQINAAPTYFNDIILQPLKDNGIQAWVAGGAVRDYFMQVKPTDYDLFFPSSEDYNKCKTFFESNGATKVWESKNGLKMDYKGNVFDLVKRFYNSAADVIQNFDFTVSMFITDGRSLWGGDSSFKDLDGRNLVIHKVTNPDSTIKRVFKYFDKGFSISKYQIQKLANQVKKTTSSNFNGGATDVSGDYLPDDNTPDPTQNQPFCQSGQILVNGACIDAPTPPPPPTTTCLPNQVLINNICVPIGSGITPTPLPYPVPPVIYPGGGGGGGGTTDGGGTETTPQATDYTIYILIAVVGGLALLSEN